MSSSLKNLSEFDPSGIPDGSDFNIGIVTSEWNREITGALLDGAVKALTDAGVKTDRIHKIDVPGSYELTSGARLLAAQKKCDAIICLGCVIQGETRHFDFICNAVAQGLTNLSLMIGIPVIFGVLTTDNMKQAKERSGGKHGNKGVEAAVTALKMAALKNRVQGKGIGYTGKH